MNHVQVLNNDEAILSNEELQFLLNHVASLYVHVDLNDDGDMVYFDDVGCMILWAKEKNIDLRKVKSRIFSNDTKKYIDPFKGYFQINERTPMLYGFSAYEKSCEGCINFDEVIIKMLRGEHMANPKIRKQILGY